MNTAPLVISVSSGKGGVGKTNFAVNLSVSLARYGKRVVLVDADLGLANVDILLGVMPPYNIFDLFHRGLSLDEVLYETPYNFKILPASSGMTQMLSLDTGQKLEFLEILDDLEEKIDYMIVDTGAGIHENVLYFNLASQERVVLLTNEPTSLTDAYALIKVLKLHHGIEHFKIVINMANTEAEAKAIFKRLYAACDHFLSGVSLDYLGSIPRDMLVRKSVINQIPFCINEPKSKASMAVESMTKAILTWEVPKSMDGNIKFFWKKLLFRED